MKKLNKKMTWTQAVLSAFLFATIATILNLFMNWDNRLFSAMFYFVLYIVCAYFSQIILKSDR
ncbi:hypothetical protein CUU66_14025 [Peribacillus deserti]|uniref:Uncharacterized protein n=1 Tax=Peribacillus deserti TaxID=673318 RepID=A0A2N5M4J5_9BACI|nr:hypothetical protein CUU66_14025 [Peribacillus deserti]